jgi:NADP-dependent 3-hydroxy acid dehydrogenase YdfG
VSKILSGRVALVTGASSGIGEATAVALSRAGAKVAVVARRRERLEQLVLRLAAKGSDTLLIEADLREEGEAQRCVAETEAAFGRLDILVNNAGVMYLEPIADAKPEHWVKMMELNLLAVMLASQAALPGMRKRRDGHIVNVSSTAGRIANPNASAYAATKFGVVAFSESLRRESYMDNVRVCVIEPGIVETELREHIAHAPTKQSLDGLAASMRQLTSQDVANAILYVVSQPPHVNINEILMRPTDQER